MRSNWYNLILKKGIETMTFSEKLNEYMEVRREDLGFTQTLMKSAICSASGIDPQRLEALLRHAKEPTSREVVALACFLQTREQDLWPQAQATGVDESQSTPFSGIRDTDPWEAYDVRFLRKRIMNQRRALHLLQESHDTQASTLYRLRNEFRNDIGQTKDDIITDLKASNKRLRAEAGNLDPGQASHDKRKIEALESEVTSLKKEISALKLSRAAMKYAEDSGLHGRDTVDKNRSYYAGFDKGTLSTVKTTNRAKLALEILGQEASWNRALVEVKDEGGTKTYAEGWGALQKPWEAIKDLLDN